jgi:hypothetical protein
MRILVSILVCAAVLSTTPAFAQDDHNDGVPFVQGYAVVTPAGVISPGTLVAFETFGWRSEVPALRASVQPAMMTTRTVLFAGAGIRLSRNVGVAISNPGSTDAVVTMTLRRATGIVTAQKTITVVARQQVARFVSDFFADVPALPADLDGTLTLTSNTPVAVVALRFTGTRLSTIPLNSLSPSVDVPGVTPRTGGSNAVLFPQFAADGGWASEIVVLNTGTLPLTVRIDLFKQDGTPLVTTLNHQSGSSFQDLVIAPGATIVFSPWDANGNSDF